MHGDDDVICCDACHGKGFFIDGLLDGMEDPEADDDQYGPDGRRIVADDEEEEEG